MQEYLLLPVDVFACVPMSQGVDARLSMSLTMHSSLSIYIYTYYTHIFTDADFHAW